MHVCSLQQTNLSKLVNAISLPWLVGAQGANSYRRVAVSRLVKCVTPLPAHIEYSIHGQDGTSLVDRLGTAPKYCTKATQLI